MEHGKLSYLDRNKFWETQIKGSVQIKKSVTIKSFEQGLI